MRQRLTLWVVLLVVALLIPAGCAPRAGAPLAETYAGDELFVDLPIVVVSFNEQGEASVGGIPLSTLAATAGVALDDLSLPSDVVDFFTQSDIQHLQIVNGPERLTILVNGQQVPSLVWEEGSLVATAETIRNLGIALPVLEEVLPLVQQLGVGVALRFPVAEGNEPIPLGTAGESAPASEVQQAQQQFLEAMGDTPPRISVPIFYDEEGNFSVGDLSPEELAELAGPAVSALQLPADLIQDLTSAGVTTIHLGTDPEGIHLRVNDQALPTISWGQGELQNVLQLQVVQELLGSALDMDPNTVVEMAQGLLPIIQTAETDITIFLPGSGEGN